jgi:hypothetical protein
MTTGPRTIIKACKRISAHRARIDLGNKAFSELASRLSPRTYRPSLSNTPLPRLASRWKQSISCRAELASCDTAVVVVILIPARIVEGATSRMGEARLFDQSGARPRLRSRKISAWILIRSVSIAVARRNRSNSDARQARVHAPLPFVRRNRQ